MFKTHVDLVYHIFSLKLYKTKRERKVMTMQQVSATVSKIIQNYPKLRLQLNEG